MGVSGCSSEPTSDDLFGEIQSNYIQCIEDVRELRSKGIVFKGWSDNDIAKHCIGGPG